ncbi:hypothetical protein KY290_033588 [Solanum tuberosum]|uniref:Serine/threonine-protein kinase TOR n=1 Tax=Solanum tuberosum TaxID=4113 RepID=A0ABQ7U107_SOLTU|nr:hypothetical protein KY289_035040 [Solanum tuberosum]KAH0649257.1 hypothetical protein KY285_034505 [Solanum tuberosum]KAH0740545.1 hypothetical protein KY290_033588 [Solanum tuberosum]
MKKSRSPATQIATLNPSRILSVLDRWRIETDVEIMLRMIVQKLLLLMLLFGIPLFMRMQEFLSQAVSLTAILRYVITPYSEYPQLLGFLLKLLNGELAWSTRREVLKVLGIMGALDPHVHKRNQQSLPGSHGEVTEVAINSFVQIFWDPSLSSYHQKVVGSLMFIFKVFPDLYHIVCICEDGLKEFITWKLGTLVSIARQGKTFAKPELKSCIEEFEEKLNKFDIERKEQELTAKNAQSHQQKVESLDNITRSALFEILESILTTKSREGLRASQLACRDSGDCSGKQPLHPQS